MSKAAVLRRALRAMAPLLLPWLLVAALPACTGPSRFMRGGGQIETLSVRAVEWNPGHTEVGKVAAVADSGSDIVVFGDRGAFFFTVNGLAGSDRRFTSWRAAATIPAADREGTWIAGVDAQGHLYRVRARTSLEAISDRYGLADKPITALCALGGGLLAFALAPDVAPEAPSLPLVPALQASTVVQALAPALQTSTSLQAPAPALQASGALPASGFLALADGHTVTTYRPGGAGPLAGGGGKAAWISGDDVHVFTAENKAHRTFPLPGALHVALDATGHLHVATAHELYAEDRSGTLVLLYETASPETAITSLVASGSRVWFSEGADLGLVENAQVSITTHQARPSQSTLAPSTTGDVWSLDGGTLTRFTRELVSSSSPSTLVADSAAAGPQATSLSPQALWSAEIEPIFARSCRSCHGPNPSSGVDLSTHAAWESRRALIHLRVAENRDMPPRSHPFDEADRAVLERWTATKLP